jgi:hypothetical protein
MGNNGPVKMKVDDTMATAGAQSNVALVQSELAEERSLNIDGKSVYPEWVTTRGISLAESLRVGDGVTLTDGCVTADYIATDAVTASKINASGLSSTDISFSGTLSGFGIANLGTISGGSIAIGSGGATIGSATSGVSISGNVIRCVKSGTTTIQIDGSTGIVTCNKFAFTSDSSSSMNLSSGTHVFGTGIQVGDTTLGAISTAATGAIQPGGGVTVDGDKYITTIDLSSGLVVKSSTSNAHTQMTSNGIAVYNSSNQVVVQLDHTNGITVQNKTSDDDPENTERIGFKNNAGTEVLKMWAPYTGTAAYIQTETNYTLVLTAKNTKNAQIALYGSATHAYAQYHADIHTFYDDTDTAGGQVRAKHCAFDGSAKADTTFTFPDNDGATHTVTFEDGLIVSWSKA